MPKAETNRTRQLIDAAVGILAEEWPMTVRQLFYRLVSAEHIQNTRADYQKVSRVMTKAREDGRCPFKLIVDRSRPEYAPNVWNDAQGYADTIKRSYRKDYWVMQPNHVEIWVEKDSIIGSIEEVTQKELGITVRVGRGFMSTTRTHDIAERFAEIRKPITVFYLGDHDPSGRNIQTDVRARVVAHGSGPFSMKRLAIHAGDIKRFNLPPLRVKETDPRTRDYLSRYGNTCVELDALPPTELRRRIQQAVEELLDRDLWNRAVEVEKVELNSIIETVARWPGSKPSIEEIAG